jgi:molecular chaperone GrpE
VSTENDVERDDPTTAAAEAAAAGVEAGAGRDTGQAAATAESAPDPLAAAEAKAAEAETRAAQAYDRFLRAQAELENVRKRTARELAENVRFANEQLVRELLPVLDNLERALAAAGGDEGPVAALREGVSLTQAQIHNVLKKYGVTPVEALGRPFDPNVHEAVQRLESDQPEGTVVAELQRGYLLNGRLVRPAMVAVATPKAS